MSLAPMKRIAQAEERAADDAVTGGFRDLAEGGRALLGQYSLFRRLSAAERAALLARARVQKYAAHETIFRMDSPGDSMVAVLSGTIRISVPSPDGKEVVLAILGPGELCGENGPPTPGRRRIAASWCWSGATSCPSSPSIRMPG
jgi:hypothetical protein